MAKERILVGIDVGSSKITTVVASYSQDNTPTVIGVATVPSKGIRKGQVVDIDEAVSAMSACLEQAERMAGVTIGSAFVSVGGSHINSINSRGVVAVAGGENEITQEDVQRVTEAARAISIPSSREIIHVIPRDFVVDSQEGIKDPVGMTGVRLEVETHIISGAATSMRNLVKCVQQVGVDVEGLVFSGVSASESTLTDTERELGVALIDIGGGTTDVTLFIEGAISHSVVIPIGGKNITNDLAIGLRSSLEVAEKIKVSLSEQKKKMVGGDERENKERSDVLDISKLGINEDLGTLSKKTLLDGIIKPRLTEIFTLIGMEIKRSGYAGLLPSGLVITGGGAKTIGIESIGKDVLRMPVRVAEPTGVSGIIDEVSSPEFASSIGLILYGTKVSEESSGISLPSIRGGFNITGFLKRLLTWVRSFLP
ncbi:cell division protein FtsA [Patescibacteria group bacterium]|nr:cell division protein FtsA [Patescibacteria group bacterium]